MIKDMKLIYKLQRRTDKNENVLNKSSTTKL